MSNECKLKKLILLSLTIDAIIIIIVQFVSIEIIISDNIINIIVKKILILYFQYLINITISITP